MRRGFALLLFLIATSAPAAVLRVAVSDMIHPISEEYIERALAAAASAHDDAVVIELRTPGGLLESTRSIVEKIMTSPVPVIVYVAPAGSTAASAGFFVLESADIAAMAPGTNIGSAHPIQATGENITGDLGAKVLNDAVTRVRNLASMHNRNADWAEQAVRNSVNIKAEDAVKLHVADLAAPDGRPLLNQI